MQFYIYNMLKIIIKIKVFVYKKNISHVINIEQMQL